MSTLRYLGNVALHQNAYSSYHHFNAVGPLASCLAILRYPSPAAYSFKTVSKCSVGMLLNQYQGGMCIPGILKTAERTPRHLISPLGPEKVSTDSAVSDMYISPWL